MKKPAALVALLACGSASAEPDTPSTVTLNETRFTVEVAATDAARRNGLMYRPSLPDGHGMLFIYERPQPVVFWNKNVRFPIDILYFDTDRRLLCADQAVPPCVEECPRYRCEGPVKYVLEVGAGVAKRIGLSSDLELAIE